jgi:hypothetical protein
MVTTAPQTQQDTVRDTGPFGQFFFAIKTFFVGCQKETGTGKEWLRGMVFLVEKKKREVWA